MLVCPILTVLHDQSSQKVQGVFLTPDVTNERSIRCSRCPFGFLEHSVLWNTISLTSAAPEGPQREVYSAHGIVLTRVGESSYINPTTSWP